MTHRYAVVAVCLVLAVLAAPTIVAQETPTETATQTNTTNESAGMGTQMTAFLQSSSAAANDSVENGMWEARFEQSNASERARLVTNRTGSLEQRLERLEAQNETIQQRYENGTISEQAYVARQSQLNARIDALRTAVNDTDEAARQAGVNDSRLERLKRNASELRGPQVAGIARGLGAGPPAGAGPPDDAGPPDERGPPDEAGQGSGPNGPTGPATNTTDGTNTTSDPPGANGDDSDSPGGGSDNAGGGGGSGGGPP